MKHNRSAPSFPTFLQCLPLLTLHGDKALAKAKECSNFSNRYKSHYESPSTRSQIVLGALYTSSRLMNCPNNMEDCENEHYKLEVPSTAPLQCTQYFNSFSRNVRKRRQVSKDCSRSADKVKVSASHVLLKDNCSWLKTPYFNNHSPNLGSMHYHTSTDWVHVVFRFQA